ncbi:MAG: hypothetical protein OCC45_08300 [Desulfotalea sp.]
MNPRELYKQTVLKAGSDPDILGSPIDIDGIQCVALRKSVGHEDIKDVDIDKYGLGWAYERVTIAKDQLDNFYPSLDYKVWVDGEESHIAALKDLARSGRWRITFARFEG